MATVSDRNVIEIATFNILPGMHERFETALKEVGSIIDKHDGYVGHIAQKCFEVETRYTLVVEWRSVGDHTEKFANSPDARRCRALTREYLAGPSVVEHYTAI